ncbi:hypothetical protein VTL71DRAFT_13504 [Oculimacula yallundae]|uniref:PLD phosphodiesterase domain-containing protein n=1 Tax=Oculimacula yallundae TaxID=86028 RepID=A0ABR4CMK2_9HELO
MSNHSESITQDWLSGLQESTTSTLSDSPNYWSPSASTLLTTSQPLSFTLGTGFQILSTILQKCSTTRHELIIVTCFWATSSSQREISSLLQKLSTKGLAQNRKIQVRICFSSRSIVQKLFQTGSLNGRIYQPEEWPGLGLPEASDLEGLVMQVKSVFVRPFSVMHPKFILVDRELAFMPSCNVSWENWFEGCIEMRGGITEKLFDFYISFWAQGKTDLPPLPAQEPNSTQLPSLAPSPPPNSLIKHTTFPSSHPPPLTILLPSPHHTNPQFRLLSTRASSPPPTPLNTFLLTLFTHATRKIYIQTPNLTSKPVISALFAALSRGIDIHLVTSSRLMILEQLVTAGTITEFEVWKLMRKVKRLLVERERRKEDVERLGEGVGMGMGTLRVGYFHAREGQSGEGEPVKSHLKLCVVDEEVVVLGSGNMDRASWYTSQELGVAFFDREVAGAILMDVQEGLEGRVDYV